MKESAPISRDQWKSLLAAQSGYLLDAMDVLLYVFAINTLKKEFGLSNSMAGLIGSATLVSSAAGGILFGIMADRLGRTRTLSLHNPAIFTRLGWDGDGSQFRRS
jgi:MFS family permease